MGCCGRYTKMPSIPQQTKNLVLSVANVLSYAITTGQVKAEAQVMKVVSVDPQVEHVFG